MNLKTRTATGLALACTTALVLPTASLTAAQAKDDDNRVEIRRQGTCTGTTSAKLKAKQRDGGLEVEFEVDANRNGQRWAFRMWRNGVRFAKGTRVTTGRSGSFSVERRTSDGSGRDVISAKAANPATGEICRASLVI
jgi:hypothetical protein